MLMSILPANGNPIACCHGAFHDKSDGVYNIDIAIHRRVGSIEIGTSLKVENYVFLGSFNDLRRVAFLANTPSWRAA
jgi:hypothetical protein